MMHTYKTCRTDGSGSDGQGSVGPSLNSSLARRRRTDCPDRGASPGACRSSRLVRRRSRAESDVQALAALGFLRASAARCDVHHESNAIRGPRVSRAVRMGNFAMHAATGSTCTALRDAVVMAVQL